MCTLSFCIGNLLKNFQKGGGGGEGLTGSQFLEGVCITVSGIILASENVSLETIELLPFWYVVAEQHFVQI